MTPTEALLRKNLVTSGLSSAEWTAMSAAVRDRAFFSSRIESVRFLETCRTRIAQLLDGAKNKDGAITSRAQVVSDIMRAARDAGISQGTESLKDPGSVARANVIIDTNAAMAAGYARAEQSNTLGARLAFPAQELVRVEERMVHRQWRSIWESKGGKIYEGKRMIALKEDPIWIAISAFGHPYPPFNFNSGMGLEDVSYDEAVKLGVIKDDYQPPDKSPLKAFNETLEADLKMDYKSDTMKYLKDTFGEQIIYQDGKAMWRSQFVRDCIENSYGENGRLMKLGKITNEAFNKVPEELKDVFKGSKDERMGLTITKELATHIKKHEHYKIDPRSSNIPLMPEDLDLIPTLWRSPDRVTTDPKHPEGPVFELDTSDGGVLRLPIIKIGNTITTGTLYKKKR
ncbi:MAG: hypothetical protein J6V38_05465 [Kiritimatiellae bacterium]|nr:hypothetical protein [Kiritimatiellia bacterium]